MASYNKTSLFIVLLCCCYLCVASEQNLPSPHEVKDINVFFPHLNDNTDNLIYTSRDESLRLYVRPQNYVDSPILQQIYEEEGPYYFDAYKITLLWDKKRYELRWLGTEICISRISSSTAPCVTLFTSGVNWVYIVAHQGTLYLYNRGYDRYGKNPHEKNIVSNFINNKDNRKDWIPLKSSHIYCDQNWFDEVNAKYASSVIFPSNIKPVAIPPSEE